MEYDFTNKRPELPATAADATFVVAGGIAHLYSQFGVLIFRSKNIGLFEISCISSISSIFVCCMNLFEV